MVNGYAPITLADALEIRSKHRVIPYAGGTDLMVQNRKGCYLFLNKIDELKDISEDDTYIRIGAGVTFTQAMASEVMPGLMREAVSRIASPAIRNAGTFGGNLGNGSDKADSVLIEYATDSLVRLVSSSGERLVPVENFVIRRGMTALRDDELIAEVLIPKEALSGEYVYQKVGGRNALAISHVAFAGIFDEGDGVIKRAAAAVIADAGTVLRFRDIEERIVGLTKAEARDILDDYIAAYAERIVLGRGRVTGAYRKTVTLNLLCDFLERFIAE